MKVANPEAIRRGEKALADAIASNFDRGVIRKIFKRVHNLDVGEDVRCKNASMGVHEGEVAYSMDFEVLVNLSVFLDRSGNFLSISSSGVALESPSPEEKPVRDTPKEPSSVERPVTEPEPAIAEESDAASSGGSYESVLKEFMPIGYGPEE